MVVFQRKGHCNTRVLSYWVKIPNVISFKNRSSIFENYPHNHETILSLFVYIFTCLFHNQTLFPIGSLLCSDQRIGWMVGLQWKCSGWFGEGYLTFSTL
jgi:hypothetical protein